ncbi:type II secretion system (T2SS) protein C [Shimia isoporae]|uniref:Type II secretion system (T2SS) protein C n=1 Tax=Shimia isoporae TaxID=647720 RepID=A0A4R1N5R7_9RHOB|nr:type II secretion system protein N [Shimia isoporae]TCK99855.1 type II secretion system (T2SS) protein C [Shimia isoporae]
MRLIAFVFTLAAMAGLAFAALELQTALSNPVPPADQRVASAKPAPDVTRNEPQPPIRWPALFGTVVAEEPQPPAPPTQPREPQPPKPPAPPIDSLGYTLKGMVRTGAEDGRGDWAIVGHPTGDQLLRVGDELTDGITVVEITEEGLWVDRGGERALLGFVKE